MPNALKAPWRSERAEIRCTDVPMRDAAEMLEFLKRYEGPPRGSLGKEDEAGGRFADSRIVGSASVRLSRRREADVMRYLLNYAQRYVWIPLVASSPQNSFYRPPRCYPLGSHSLRVLCVCVMSVCFCLTSLISRSFIYGLLLCLFQVHVCGLRMLAPFFVLHCFCMQPKGAKLRKKCSG
jgi:hypothetical protein